MLPKPEAGSSSYNDQEEEAFDNEPETKELTLTRRSFLIGTLIVGGGIALERASKYIPPEEATIFDFDPEKVLARRDRIYEFLENQLPDINIPESRSLRYPSEIQLQQLYQDGSPDYNLGY